MATPIIPYNDDPGNDTMVDALNRTNNALSFLESLGYTSGDIVEGLRTVRDFLLTGELHELPA